MEENINRRLKLLTRLAEIYKTDKLQHGYLPHYARHLEFSKIHTMLEIGAGKGGSLKMWRKLMPLAQVHCMDLFEDPDHISFEEVQKRGCIPHKGDQSCLKDLFAIPGYFDLIIDDGSHNAEDMLTSFNTLYANLNRGGWYVTEDLHCCKDPFYWSSAIKSVDDTILGMCKNWEKTGHPYGAVHLYDDKILFIQKPI